MATNKEIVNAAIEKANKTFGKGIARNLGEEDIEDIEAISTGSKKLDDTLGIGGFPKGRVIDLFGKPGSGKCLPKDTLIDTKNGLETIEEIFTKYQIPLSTNNNSFNINYQLINQNGEYEQTSKFTQNAKRKVYKITTKSGYQIEATLNHPFKYMSKSGFLEWNSLKKLNKGDWIAFNREYPPIKSENKDDAYLLGLLVADGYLGQDRRILINNNDKDIKESIKAYGKKYISNGMISYSTNNRNSTQFQFNIKKDVSKFKDKYGVPLVKTKDKTIPYYIRKDTSTWKSFIQGYMDCESAVNKSNIAVTSASHILLYQLKLMLQRFGIISSIHKKPVKEYPDNNYWRLSISGYSLHLYINLIGFQSQRRLKQIENSIEDTPFNTNIDIIPHQYSLLKSLYRNLETTRKEAKIFDIYKAKRNKTISYSKLKKILSYYEDTPLFNHFANLYNKHYFYDKIENIKLVSEKPTYDFEMPKTHSLIANGAVVHNSSLTIHAIAEAQKEGAVAAFIDAEQAFSPTYAEQLGVNLEELILIQPDYGEQALDIVDSLLDTDKMDIIVIDSVPALVPKAELEENLEDQQIALQARMMSKALRRFKNKVRKTDTALIFINQIRSNMKSSWAGSSEKATGGKALKFYSDARLEIRRGKSIKSGKQIIGHMLKVQAVKNKLAPPFRKCEIPFIYGKGIDIVHDLLRAAKDTGLIIRKGAWYYYKEDQIGQGKDAAKDFIRENREQIENDLKEPQNNNTKKEEE